MFNLSEYRDFIAAKGGLSTSSGFELKPEYAKQAAKFLTQAETKKASLFDGVA